MDNFTTPNRQKVKIPASPFMKKIGFGTGVSVYEFTRSPISNKFRSPWAIKKLTKPGKKNTELFKRLQDEATILRQLVHPNIVAFKAFLKDGKGQPVLAMEECTSCLGDTIEGRFEEDLGPIEPQTILRVLRDMSEALDYLHNNMLIMHCDIKSYNILYKGNYEVFKLCDFGVFLRVDKEGNALVEDDVMEYTGTQAWCAPEVLELPPKITVKADIYALGLVIYEMIALTPPLDASMVDELEEDDDENELSFVARQRPDLPDNFDFDGKDWEKVLEIYWICTMFDFLERPSAANLKTICK